MFNRRLLFLTRDRLTAFRWRKGGVDGPPRRFNPTPEGREEFAAWVGEEPAVPMYVLADYIEEEFKNDSQPHVLGPDRSSLLELRLNRAFPATPYRYVRIVGRSREGRRDDLTLVAGLTEPGSVSAWIDILMEKQAPLAGIFSLPMVSGQLLKRMRIHTPSTLLVSLQSSSGLRFSYFHGSVLKVSRMAPVPDMAPEKYVTLFRSELDKTRGYLGSLRLLPKDTPLQVVVLSNAELIQALELHCQESATARFKLVPVGDAARKIGIKRNITTPFSDSLFIQLLGMHPGFNHYATPTQIGPYYTQLLRKTLIGLTWSVGGICTLMAGVDLYQGVDLMFKVDEAKKQTIQFQKKFRNALSQQTDTNLLPSDVRGTVELAEQLEIRRADPRELMLSVSSVLEKFPDIALEKKFQWGGPMQPETPACKGQVRKKDGVVEESQADTSAGGKLLAGAKALAKGKGSSSADNPPQDMKNAPIRQYGALDGFVRLSQGQGQKVMEAKDAQARLEAFAAALLELPQVMEVCVGDVQTQGKAEETFSLSAKTKEDVKEQIPFTLGVQLRVEKEKADAPSEH